MIYSIPMDVSLGNRAYTAAIGSTARQKASTRLAAAWFEGGVSSEMGRIISFNGNTSFAGTYGSLKLAWPDNINPRTSGGWWNKLIPNDLARVNIALAVKLSGNEVSIPLMQGVPAPDGIMELYGGQESIDIRLQDVTGVIGRVTDYTVPYISADSTNPLPVVAGIIGAIPAPLRHGGRPGKIHHVVHYRPVKVDGCISKHPHALAAVHDLLVAQQETLNPKPGKLKKRHGDRHGKLVFHHVQDPALGAPFLPDAIFAGYDFDYGAHQISKLTLEGEFLTIVTPFINPYLELGSRINLSVPRANISETVQVREIRWSVNPAHELMTLKCRRQYTL